MKKPIFWAVLTGLVFCSTVSFADSPVPNLVGTWVEKSDKVVLVKGDKTPWQDKPGISCETRIIEQKGRIIHGEAILPSGVEKIAGIIAADNKSVYMVDEDGTIDLKIINKDKIQFVHRHVMNNDCSVVAGTWTRKK
jgi:hypothetical protein